MHAHHPFHDAWHLGPDLAALADGLAVPWTLGDGSVDAPVLSLRDADGALRTLSNACTHRGAVLLTAPGRSLRCPYHGRRFDRCGRVTTAPGFPTPPDEPLPSLPTRAVGPFLLAALPGTPPLEDRLGATARVLDALPANLTPHPDDDAVHEIAAPWWLYLENYLEGLHVPFVHPRLSGVLDLDAYRVETARGAVLQVAIARRDDDTIDLPAGHPDQGQRIAAYYLAIFPGLLLNVYPWGLSLNHVRPRGADACTVVYRTWVADPTRRGRGAGADLATVEAEDQAVLARVTPALRSPLFQPGALAPGHEDGIAAFRAWRGG